MFSFKKIKILFMLIFSILLICFLIYHNQIFKDQKKFYHIKLDNRYLPVNLQINTTYDQLVIIKKQLFLKEQEFEKAFKDPYKFNIFNSTALDNQVIFSAPITHFFNTLKESQKDLSFSLDSLSKDCQANFDIDSCFSYLSDILNFQTQNDKLLFIKKRSVDQIYINPHSLLLESYYVQSLFDTLKSFGIQTIFIQSQHLIIGYGYQNTLSWKVIFNNKPYYIKNTITFYSPHNILILPYKDQLIMPMTLFLSDQKISESLTQSKQIASWKPDFIQKSFHIDPYFMF